jgi:hypothetical protein
VEGSPITPGYNDFSSREYVCCRREAALAPLKPRLRIVVRLPLFLFCSQFRDQRNNLQFLPDIRVGVQEASTGHSGRQGD